MFFLADIGYSESMLQPLTKAFRVCLSVCFLLADILMVDAAAFDRSLQGVLGVLLFFWPTYSWSMLQPLTEALSQGVLGVF